MKGDRHMKLYCYEICDDNKSSNTERVIGLSEVGGTKRVKTVKIASEESLESTDEDSSRDTVVNQCEVPLFTEIGRMAFKRKIEDVATTYANGPFYVKEISVELSEHELNRIRHVDEYQVRVNNKVYDELKADRYMMDE